jgi:hypothetical protein
MSIDFEGMYRQARAEATDVSEHLLHYLGTIKSPLWRIQLLALLSPRMRSVTQVLTTTQLDVQALYYDLSAGYETPLFAAICGGIECAT